LGSLGFSGVIEEIGIGTTKIRDVSGQLHILFNGNITLVKNFTALVRSLVILFPNTDVVIFQPLSWEVTMSMILVILVIMIISVGFGKVPGRIRSYDERWLRLR